MPLYQPIIPVRYVQPLLELVRAQQPADIAAILRAGGVSEAELRSSATLTMAQFDALYVAAAGTLGRTDLGFALGDRIGRDSHDALSTVLRSCRTLDATLRMIARYWRLIIPGVRLRYVRRADHGEYVFRPGAATSQATLYGIEEIFAVGFHRDCVRLLGKPAGLEIWLSMPPPPHWVRYRELTPTRFHFSASPLPEVRCVIPATLLDRPLPGASAADTTAIDALLQAGTRGERRPRVSDWIELMLREAEGVQPSLAELAGLLHVSARTLSRQLAAEGCNLRRLSSAIRYQRACTLLRDSMQPIEQIGARLGYGSPAAFSTAFRNCGGVSPRHYRGAQRGECASPGTPRSDTLRSN